MSARVRRGHGAWETPYSIPSPTADRISARLGYRRDDEMAREG
jgi:hypothetical protein